MKFSTAATSMGALLIATVASIPIRRAVDPSQVLDFGVVAGTAPDGNGNCKGINNINIPCNCPPSRDDFINSLNANVAAGHAVNNPGVAVQFPSDNTPQAAATRIQAQLVTLQNLRGPGVGCPASATTFLAALKEAQAGQIPGGPAAAPAAPAPPPAAPAAPAGDAFAAKVPALGFTAGRNPTGTGDCDGAVNGPDGKPVKIPCACPPAQDVYVNALKANAAAGHAVNNPGVAVSFPLDDSKNSQITRIQAALVTLQNLNGPGKGCPAAATTLLGQLKSLQG